MEIIKGTKVELGSCNFHTDNDRYYIVYELRTPTIAVRICGSCFKKAKESIKR